MQKYAKIYYLKQKNPLRKMSIYTYNMYVKKKNSLTMKKYKFLFHKTIEKS